MIDPKTNPGSAEHESTERYEIDVAPRVRSLPPYLFGRINELKYRKRRDGIDVIDLGMGNPTDPPEQWVVDKLCEAARDSRNHRYSVATGVFNLRREVANRYEARFEVSTRSRPGNRRNHWLQRGFQPHVLGASGPWRYGDCPGPELSDSHPRDRSGLGQRDHARRARPGQLPLPTSPESARACFLGPRSWFSTTPTIRPRPSSTWPSSKRSWLWPRSIAFS